jgi:CRISPR-associated helicase cas3
MLKKELEKKFKLNKMQEEALKSVGENLIFNAPTGSGKTEAILLSIPEGKKVSYLLPTITSSIFMYRRLAESGLFNVEVKTSLLKEKALGKGLLNIQIHTPDPALLDFLEKGENSLSEVVVMDELDNYPSMVKRVLLEYIKANPETQYIVASATLDNELLDAFKDFKKIDYKTDLDFIKFRTDSFEFDSKNVEDLKEIINSVSKNKKIGFIFNSIDNMETFKEEYAPLFLDENGELYDDVVFHHSALDVDKRNENEKRLFDKDFKICISNDIISYSVDIDFDIMFLECSDRKATNIQRLGRCNRYNQMLDKEKTNVYVIQDMYAPIFIDSFDKCAEEEIFAKTELNYQDIEKMRKELDLEKIPSLEKVNDFIEERKKMGLEPSLREVPVTFEIEKEEEVYNKKTKSYSKEIKKYHIKPNMNVIPYSFTPYSLVFDKNDNVVDINKDIVFLAKKRVCYGDYKMLTNTIPIKTVELDEEDYNKFSEQIEYFDTKTINSFYQLTKIILNSDFTNHFLKNIENFVEDDFPYLLTKFLEKKELNSLTSNDFFKELCWQFDVMGIYYIKRYDKELQVLKNALEDTYSNEKEIPCEKLKELKNILNISEKEFKKEFKLEIENYKER